MPTLQQPFFKCIDIVCLGVGVQLVNTCQVEVVTDLFEIF